MNIVQLQDMLRGIPDDRLQTEMSQPTGNVPQYLVLSEIVRRDKARSSSAEAPKTTVVEDMMNQAQAAGGINALTGAAPVAPEQELQEAPAMYAGGGFISAADAMGNSGVAGYPQSPPRQSYPLSPQPQQTSGSMFTPNTNPAPAPQTNFNLTQQQPPADNGMQNNANVPSFMEQPNGYAQGGVIALAGGGTPQDIAFFIKREADRLGIDPVDLATTISYETAGTFDPAKKGPTTKWGKHIGLIQMGGPQRKQYGYDPGGSLDSQMKAVGDYLADRGVKPGMGLLDVYSTVNAGSPGLYNRSDEKAGGAPGSVLDKVRDQMSGHKEKAMNLLGMIGQNAGDYFLGSPTGMAGRETMAGLGQGAGGAAIGQTGTPVAGGTSRQNGIMSLFQSGSPSKPSMAEGLRDIGSTMAQGQQAPEAPDAPMKSADISGLDRLRTSPEEDLAQYAALRQQYITGGYADGGTIRMADGTPEDQRGFMEWMMGVTPEEAAAKRQAEADTTAAEDAKTLYEADPERKKRILGERGPLEGNARIPEEAAQIAANSAPSPYQLMAGSQERQQKMLQDYYDSLIQLERDRMNESQGFGSFLKDIGRGMLSNTSAFGPSVSAGVSRAVGGREDTAAASREKTQELEMAKKKAQIEGLGALDKLRYEQAIGDKLGSRETAQYILPALNAQLKSAVENSGPDSPEAVAIRKTIADVMSSLGYNVPVTSPEASPEAESESGFWSILGK